MKIQSFRSKQDGIAHLALLVVAVVVIVGGVGAYLVMNGPKKNDGTGGLQVGLPFTSKTATTTADIKAMVTSARAGTSKVKCNYIDDSGKASAIYITKDKMRVDTTIIKSPGHMLWLSDKAYLWADGNPKGSILPVNKDNDTSSQQTDKFANDVAKYKMSCQTVNKLDDSLFKVPTDVTFTVLNSQLHSSSSN